MPEDFYENEEAPEETSTASTAIDTDIPSVIYTGPNIFAIALRRFQVFRGGLPPYVKRAIEIIPDIQKLIVPVNELEAMRAKIDKPGTSEARFFVVVEKAAEKLSRERKVKK